MNLTQLKFVFLVAVLFPPINGSNDTRCIGDDPAVMADGCNIIESKPLIFKDTSDVNLIKKKMKTVKSIQHGVEVIGTKLEIFDFLSHVPNISNPDGPALTFKDNKHLKRIKMTSLVHFKGKDTDVFFNNDNYPSTAYKDSESFNDLLHLEKVARETHGRGGKCSSEFIKVVTAEPSPSPPSGYGWIFYLPIVLSALLILLLAGQIFFYCRNTKAMNAYKKDNRGNGKKGKSGKKSSKESKEGVEENTQSAEKVSGAGNGNESKEDPKEK